jgi:hypothetical protein
MILKIESLLVGITLLLVSVSPSYAIAFPELDPTGALFGPTFITEVSGVSPVVQGTWVPSGGARFGYSWLEPMTNTRLGSELGKSPQFIRFGADTYITPWYGMLQTMIGLRLIPHTEIAFVYQANAYFLSNANIEDSNLRGTWRADYIIGQAYSQKSMDFSQAFGLWASMDFSLKAFSIGGEFRHFLIDVQTENQSKSFDYVRGLPIYGRDFFLEALGWVKVPISQNVQMGLEIEYQQAGLFTKMFGNYEKQPVRQGMAFLGPQWRSPRGRYSLVVEPGFFIRQQDYLKGSIAEQVLFRAIWQTRFAWDRR